jgi:uncharacterized protein YcbX
MAGEPVPSALLTENGIEGDRLIQVVDGRGRTVTSRTHPGLLGFHATLDAGGQARIDGVPWTEPSVLARVRSVAGPEARLIRDESPDRFDILPLLVATDGSIAAFGRDGRRLRPNIVIGGVEGLAERSWERGVLFGGNAVIGIHDLRGRCVMTTFDPDTLQQDRGVLFDIVKRFQGKLALNCEVLQGGRISVGDPVEFSASWNRQRS